MRNITLLLVSLLTLTGCGTPSFLITPVANTNKLTETTLQTGGSWGSGKILIIPVEGMLANAKEGGFLQPTENPLSLFTQQLELAEADKDIRGVLLRVNSPGGTVSCSDSMYEQIVRFRKRTGKPVVAAFQEVAASGAYYLACGCDRIVAQPTTVVGSIGVVFYTFNFSGTLNKIGAQSEALKSGPLKDMGSPFRPSTPEDRAVMQGMIDEYYARFLGIVTENRHDVATANLKTIADGRVFSGRQAKDLGLVDDLGLLEDAIRTTRKLARAPGAQVIMYKRPYGYSGSIYASNETPTPQASNTTQLQIPGMNRLLPTGFYYLWNP
ncbi:MAG TPA: signal peptide peptidase SppA [Tepidisphaeraceae bacterium]|jgi:protease-4